MLQLAELKSGDRVRLNNFGATKLSYRRKLLALGLICGTEVMIERIAPLGCPVLIQLRGAYFSLRKDEAKELLWEKL